MFGGGMDDIFNSFFAQDMMHMGGHPGGGRGGARGNRVADTRKSVAVSLEDLYTGTTMEVSNRRTVCCRECRGSGTKKKMSKASGMCTFCRGSGARIRVVNNGIMIQQMQTVCDVCNGTGQRIDPKDRCAVCSGSKTTVIDGNVTVTVEPGMSHLQELLYRGMGNEHPEITKAGDLVVRVEQTKHEKFIRNGDDLHMTQRITLAEALCGFQYKFTQLDGRELVVRRNRGTITKPGEQCCILSEGMPANKRKGTFGNMVVTFEVVYPERVNDSQIQLLREALPPPKSHDAAAAAAAAEDDAEKCYVSRQSWDIFREEISRDDDDNEDEEGYHQAGGQNVNCQAA